MSLPFAIDQETFWASGTKTAHCLRIVQETWDVKTFWFELENQAPLAFKAGQFLSFTFLIDGQSVSRCYSISSSPNQPYQFGITVKQVEGGLVSNWLHEHLAQGQTVTVAAPMGHFNCVDVKADKYLLLSGGSGITPSMSMTRWLQALGQKVDIHFVHSARSPDDIIFYQELLQIDAQWGSFQLSILCEDTQQGQAWSGYRGRLTPELLKILCADFKERIVMCCGPAPYMQAVKAMLEALNFPMEHYYEESFGTPLQTPTLETITSEEPQQAQTVNVTFAQTNKQVVTDTNQSVLDIAQANGVWIQSACRTGICGSCKVIKKDGSVIMHDPIALTDAEIEEGYILACCAYPEADLLIEA